jgi:iron complex outermembrane receptor protein
MLFVQWFVMCIAAPPHSSALMARTGTDSTTNKTLASTSQRALERITRVPSITVTTTRAEKLTSPVAFSELSRAELQRIHTYQDLPAVLAELPSTIFYSDNGNNVGYSTLSMRGFDQRRISVMINGIPQNDPEDHNTYWINFPDLASNLASIQVQRGAGYANYGQAAIGGSIHLTTSNFADKSFVMASLGMGMQEFGAERRAAVNLSRFSVEGSTGLFELGGAQYAVYGRGSLIRSDGYREQSWAHLASFFIGIARFDERLTTQFNVFGGPIADGLAYTGLPKSYVGDLALRRRNYSAWGYDAQGKLEYTVPRRSNEIENFSQPHVELLNDWTISPNLTLKSSLFYYQGDGFFDFDGSWADAAMLRITPEFGFRAGIQPENTIIRAYVGNRQGGWLPRLVWAHDIGAESTTPLRGEMTIGAELRIHRSTHWGKIASADGLPRDFDMDYKFYSYNGERDIFSAFVREQLWLSSALSVNLEAQLVRHAYRIRNERAGNQFTRYSDVRGNTVGNGNVLFEVPFVFFNPRFGVNYLLNEQWSVFTSIAHTSREPRMRNLYAASDSYFGATPLFTADTSSGRIRYDFSRPLVRPERLLDIELGSRFQSETLSFAVNAYWMEFNDELVRNGQLDIFGAPVDGNAPRTRHVGLELEAGATLLQGTWGRVRVLGNATVSRNVILDYTVQNDDGSSTSLAGNAIAGFPDVMGQARLNYEYESETNSVAASLQGRHVGAFYTDNTQNERRKNDAYTVFNVDASYTFKNVGWFKLLRLRAQVNNLFNRLYSSGGVGDEFFVAAERNYFFALELGF